MNKFLHIISEAGATGDRTLEEVRKIRLQNEIAGFISLFSLFFLVVNIYQNKPEIALINFGTLVFLMLTVYLNHKGKLVFSSILFFTSTFVAINLICIYSKQRDLEYLLLIAGIFSMLLFQNKIIVTSLFILSFIMFIIAKLTAYGQEYFVLYLNYALIFALTYLTILYLKNEFERIHHKLELNNERLKKLNNEKNQLISIASHDLRSPLARVKGLISLLTTGNSLTPDQREILAKASQEINQQEKMVNEILNVYAIEEEPEPIHLGKIEVLPIIKNMISVAELEAARKNISIQLINNAGSDQVMGNQDYLQQVFDNLLSNAIKFSFPNTTVTIVLHSDSQKFYIDFKDEGQGLDEADQKRLFKRFQRLSARPTGGEPSTGLGLAISKGYVDSMKGSLHCISEKGRGSTFTVVMPYS